MTYNHAKYPLITPDIEQKLIQAQLTIQTHTFSPGQLLLTKGEISERIYIVLTGQVRVFIEDERKIQLALLDQGQFFGEMSCLTGDPISAHVETVDEVTAISVCRQGMLLLMDQNADFRMQIIESMVKRIQNSNERVVEEHQKNILLIKHHEMEDQERYGELIGNSPKMQQLQGAITASAHKQMAIAVIGEPGTEKISVARKIHEHASNAAYPFLLLDAQLIELDVWHSKIQIAHGGTVVIEHADLAPSETLISLINHYSETRFILSTIKALPFDLPAITVPPLRERTEDIPLIAQHFAVKAGAVDAENAIAQDALRLIALFPFLTKNVDELRDLINEAYILSEGRTIYSKHLRFGKNRKPGERPKIGLALGSGSARGLAHLGVIEVLERENIPIDIIAGTSAGSLMGGGYAAGLTPKECANIISKIRWRDFLRPTLTKQGIVHNLQIIQYIEKHLGQLNIEDLKIPFAAVASDLSTGDAHIMKKGSLAHAIAASTAIPSLIRPVQYEGKTLVDGAIVHPVPAALAKSMGADIVIASNVCSEKFTKGTTKNFIESILNTIDIMSAKLVKEELQLADVILRPDLGINQIHFKDAEFCMTSGMTVTQEAIERIRKVITTN